MGSYTSAKSALIFGASGVSGWSFVNEILHGYPSTNTFGRVHALTNRPLSQSASHWPKDSRLTIVSGIDLLAGSQEALQSVIKGAIPDITSVTHVYYLAYKANADFEREYEDAVSMFARSATAMDNLCPNLEFIVLQTGAKMYGCHLLENRPKSYISPPLSESHPRINAEDGGGMLFYHPQLDFITSFAADKPWNWCETRPDIIIGFVPNGNAYSLATSLGIYLSLFREVSGEQAECPFPGTQKSWAARSNDSSADMIARQTIYLSLNLPLDKKGMAFNVADARESESWETKWPQICALFELKGTPPLIAGKKTLEVREFIAQNFPAWQKMEERYSLRTGIVDCDLTFRGFEYFLLTQFDFDRQYDMSRIYETGFMEERGVTEAWGGVFDRMRGAKIIP